MGKNIIHSLCVSVSVYLWLPENIVACEFHWHWGFVYIVECHLISPHLSSYTYMYIHVRKYMLTICLYHFATVCLSFSVELPGSWLSILSFSPCSYAIDFAEYRLLLCSRTTHAKLLTCYGLPLHAWWLLGFFRDLSQCVLCCSTPVILSSHCCLCMHHVHVAFCKV